MQSDSSISSSNECNSDKVDTLGLPYLLLVNDNVVLLDILSYRLESIFAVIIACSGMEAFEIVKKHPKNHFDVILLDINMPIMDGFEAFNIINEHLQQNVLSRMLSIVESPSNAVISSSSKRSSTKRESPCQSREESDSSFDELFKLEKWQNVP